MVPSGVASSRLIAEATLQDRVVSAGRSLSCAGVYPSDETELTSNCWQAMVPAVVSLPAAVTGDNALQLVQRLLVG